MSRADRREEIALAHKDGTIWLAYRTSGGHKAESVYVAGWDLEGKSGGPLYAALHEVLESQFGTEGALGWGPYFDCDEAYISNSMPDNIHTIFEEFFTTNKIKYSTVRPGRLSKKTANGRWAEAMGEPLQSTKEDAGYLLALAVLTRGVKSGATVAS